MQNPFLNPIKNFYIYLSVWAMVILAHTFLLTSYFEVWILFSFLDALIFNFTFAAVCIGLWYPVRFLKIEKQKTFKVLLYHATAAFFFISIWIGTCSLLLFIFTWNDVAYFHFFDASLPVRFISGFLYYSVIILFYYLIIYYASFKENMLKSAQLAALVKETQLELLKSQLNPHFIFNALNSISSLTISSPEKAQEMVVKLSSFLRYSLGERTRMVTLAEELENVLLYLDIEKVRFGDRLKILMNIAEESKKVKIPELILQPLIENAIKHGMYEKLDQVTVQIYSTNSENICIVTIENDTEEIIKNKSGKGHGLKNVRERLSLVYGKGDWLETSNENQIFKAQIKIPIRNT